MSEIGSDSGIGSLAGSDSGIDVPPRVGGSIKGCFWVGGSNLATEKRA